MMALNAYPRISIVINTLNRGASLQQTLTSFKWLKYSGEFEVVVVNGPSTDDSQKVIESWLPQIRVGRCDVANLSKSRNIGIAMAQGDVVAFIDDDGIPEPEWLEQIAHAYASSDVGAVGGFVFDHTGYDFQAKYCVVDRLGNADESITKATPQLSFPRSFRFPHLLGTNSTFRRDVLLQVGGFDEEYEYFLDETDVCLRVVDAGYVIQQLPNAYVHHKFAPSNLRGKNRVAKYRYPIIKNKIYFMLKNAREYFSLEQIEDEYHKFITRHRNDVNWCVSNSLLSKEDAVQFEQDAEKALRVGVLRGEQGALEMLTSSKVAQYAGDFLPFVTINIQSPLSVILISRDYPPNQGGGIATFTRDLAVALAAQGNIVHVITQSPDINRVDFEHGVWVHRILSCDIGLSLAAQQRHIPQHIWNWSATALREAERISTHRHIDIVEAPIWDCEGIAFLLDSRWPLVTSLHTTLKFAMEYHPEWKNDPNWLKSFGEPMLLLEKELMQCSQSIRANSHAIVADIESAYDFKFNQNSLTVIPHGLVDMDVTSVNSNKNIDELIVLYVGRLEHRKGIDVLLAAIPSVIEEFPHVKFRILGNASLNAPEGKTYQMLFEQSKIGKSLEHAVRFEGMVSNDVLQEAYQNCDIFVAPSRYESFGLIFLEAMRAGKPVIGCLAGGMPEVISEGINGLLVPPNDIEQLSMALKKLLSDQKKRVEMGMRGSQMFMEKFSAMRMADDSVAFYRKII
ncbi:glycosyltransferase [Moraxellaceae bacterium AER2_44_116]|nr:glycosyltransferase [Moraxellaceae bacterium]TQC98943.1 glycosyltransferase [Moraxellaceae bacterium AER2_44_116]